MDTKKYLPLRWMQWDFLFFLACVLTSVCVIVPFAPNAPSTGLDPSWQIGMNQAVAQKLDIGKSVIFTFGPYAEIYTKLFHPSTDRITLWSAIYISIWFGVVAFLCLKKSEILGKMPFLVFLASFTYSRDSIFFIYPLMVFFYVFQKHQDSDRVKNNVADYILEGFLFSVFGIIPLIKGPFLGGVVALSLLSWFIKIRQNDWRGIAIEMLAPILAMIFFWGLSGQRLTELPAYILSLREIISGYTEAMSINGNGAEVLLFIGTSIIILYSVWRKTHEKKYEYPVLLVLAFFIILFISFKAGFVRHDGHAVISSTTLMLLILLFSSSSSLRITALPLVLAVATWMVVDANYIKTNSFVFLENLKGTFRSAWNGALLRVSQEEKLSDEYKASILQISKNYRLPLLDGTSDIYSFDQSYLIASGNIWNPRPIFQSYSAYTPSLAQLNKEHLLASNAPDHLFFSLQPIDGRLPSLEDGVSWPLILDRYAPKYFANQHLVLDKRKHAAGLIETRLGGDYAKLGDYINIPAENDLLFVKIKILPTILGRIASFIYKPTQLEISLKLENGDVKSYRIISGMTQTGFIISPLVENNAEFISLYIGEGLTDHKKVKSFAIRPRGGRFLWKENYELEYSSLKIPPIPEALSLLQYDVLQKIKYPFRPIVAPRCDGGIDYINGGRSAASIVHTKKWLTIDGWLAKSAEKGEVPNALYAVLASNNGEYFFAKLKNKRRPDVAALFNNLSLDNSGYEALLDTGGLKGKYNIKLAYGEGGVIYICPQFNAEIEIE